MLGKYFRFHVFLRILRFPVCFFSFSWCLSVNFIWFFCSWSLLIIEWERRIRIHSFWGSWCSYRISCNSSACRRRWLDREKLYWYLRSPDLYAVCCASSQILFTQVFSSSHTKTFPFYLAFPLSQIILLGCTLSSILMPMYLLEGGFGSLDVLAPSHKLLWHQSRYVLSHMVKKLRLHYKMPMQKGGLLLQHKHIFMWILLWPYFIMPDIWTVHIDILDIKCCWKRTCTKGTIHMILCNQVNSNIKKLMIFFFEKSWICSHDGFNLGFFHDMLDIKLMLSKMDIYNEGMIHMIFYN